jgi:hypothetical protein
VALQCHGQLVLFEALSPSTPFVELLGQLNKTIGPDLDLHIGNTTFLRGLLMPRNDGDEDRLPGNLRREAYSHPRLGPHELGFPSKRDCSFR